MSWQDHVAAIMASPYVESALIIDLASQAIVAWDGPLAHNPGENIQQDVVNLLQVLSEPSVAQAKGVSLGGHKYLCIRAEDSLFYGKKGACGVCAVKTKKLAIVGTYGDGTPTPKHNQVIEGVRDNFAGSGY